MPDASYLTYSSRCTRLALLVGLLVCATLTRAGADEKRVIAMLAGGGYVIVMRHGATDASTSDVYPLDYANPKKQRQLSPAGRETASTIGAAMRAASIPIGRVMSSKLDRAVETARLVTGKTPETDTLLNDSSGGAAGAMSSEKATQNATYARALRRLAATLPPARTDTLIVTHKTNIQDAFGSGLSDVAEGEAIVFRSDGGEAKIVGRLKPGDWMVK